MEPKDFVIVDGLLPLHARPARACFDVTVFLDPPETVRKMWKIRRDNRVRGYTEEQLREEMHAREEDSQRFVRPQRA